MNLPEKNLDTPFNITRTSHVVLTVKDLEASRLFYTEVVGLMVTEQDGGTLYLRGVEEACHHSLVLKQSNDAPRCERIGMRVLGLWGGRRGRFASLPLAGGWTKHRDMPAPAGRTFMDLYKAGRRA